MSRQPSSLAPEANSQIHFGLEIPLANLQSTLNQNLEKLLYTEEGLIIGDGLFADVLINKNGMLQLAFQSTGKLVMTMPVFMEGKLKLEKKIFGQSVSTALPFEESLTPKVSFKPVFKKDWSFGIEELEIESWGRSMQLDLLGYQIDFEPLVRKRMKAIITQQLDKGALAQLNFKNLAQTTWDAYSKPIHIHTEMVDNYLYTIPKSLSIKEQFTTDQHLLLQIGMEGVVHNSLEKLSDYPDHDLPDLTLEHSEGNFLNITLPLGIGYAQIDEYLNATLRDSSLKVDSKTQLIPHEFETGHYGDKALVKMEFTAKRIGKKDLKGAIFLVGKPIYNSEIQSIMFTGIDFDLKTENFYANTANWLKKRKIRNAIQKNAVYPVKEFLEKAREEVGQMGGWTTSFASANLDNITLSVDGIHPQEDKIMVYIKTTGDIKVAWQ
ncbi:MAG: DUF4403 family protein [Cyclobacteriaceae bacterium]